MADSGMNNSPGMIALCMQGFSARLAILGPGVVTEPQQVANQAPKAANLIVVAIAVVLLLGRTVLDVVAHLQHESDFTSW